MPKPIDYARGSFAAIAVLVVYRSFVDPMFATTVTGSGFWWALAKWGALIGVGLPAAFVATRLFDLCHRLLGATS